LLLRIAAMPPVNSPAIHHSRNAGIFDSAVIRSFGREMSGAKGIWRILSIFWRKLSLLHRCRLGAGFIQLLKNLPEKPDE